MDKQIEKYRQFLLLFSLLWVNLNLLVLRYYPELKDFGISKLSSSDLNILFLLAVSSLISLAVSSVYIYRLAAKVKVKSFSPKVITGLFVVISLSLGAFSMVIAAFLLWKTKPKPVKKQDSV